jgi:hypothetical protein
MLNRPKRKQEEEAPHHGPKTHEARQAGSKRMTRKKRRKTHAPGDIIAFRRRPRLGEILCHNHVAHTSRMTHGVNGFRWFRCKAGSRDWEVCPCGWRADLGIHYAEPEHIRWARWMLKKFGSQEAFERYMREFARLQVLFPETP